MGAELVPRHDGMAPLGQTLDALGVVSDVPHRAAEGHLIVGALVVLKVIGESGDAYVACANSDGLDWLTERALLEVALDTIRQAPPREDD